MDLNFYAYRHDNPMLKAFPFGGKAMHTVNHAGEDWLLVQLTTALNYKATHYNYVLIKRADKGTVAKGLSNQLVQLILIQNPANLQTEINLKEEIAEEHWALCR